MSLYVPKPIVLGLGYLIAAAFGWMLYTSVTGIAHAEAPALSGALSAPTAAPARSDALSSAEALSESLSSQAASLRGTTKTAGSTAPEQPDITATSIRTAGATTAPTVADQAPATSASSQISPAMELPTSTVSALSPADTPPLGATFDDQFAGVPALLASSATTAGLLDQAPAIGPDWMVGPGSYIAPILAPLPGVQTRAIAISEWESYRTEVVGRNILAATDDSNVFVNRDGKINGNTGDTDASGLNITDARNSVIRGTESADSPPWAPPGDDDNDDDDEDEDEEDDEDGEDTDTGDEGDDGDAFANRIAPMSPLAAFAAVTNAGAVSEEEGFDFPYVEWLRQIGTGQASAVHTDEGTTLAFGQDAVVIGGDGYDDDDNRAVGENLILTRDDCNIVVGGTGPVNAQIGDSEQGAVIMDVDNVLIEGGGAY